MSEAFGKILCTIFEDLGCEFLLNINFSLIFYFLLFVGLIVTLYMIAWRKLMYYSRLMDSFVAELWEKEEYQVNKDDVSDDVKYIRMQRLKSDCDRKINAARKKRNLLFKIPLMKWIYKKKMGSEVPMYLSS